MAYEGLDVPDISHVAYLRTIRSIPWMSQAVERGARFDAGCGVPYDDQWCHVFCPDDAEMQAFVESIRAQCAQTVLERHERAAAAAAGRHRGIGIIPRAAEAKGSTWMTDAGDVARRAAGVVEKVRALDPAMRSISARAALKVGAMLDWSRLPNTEGE
jgi:hypothetical protein